MGILIYEMIVSDTFISWRVPGPLASKWLTYWGCPQYATTPFKGVERNDTFHNILNLPVHFRDTPKVSP